MTKLAFRGIKERLTVAFVADACIGPFEYVPAKSTLDRMFEEEVDPYSKMWGKITQFYNSNCWDDLSDDRLKAILQETSRGKNRSVSVTSGQVNSAANRWLEYGWVNYEEKKSDKIRKATKYGRFALLGAGALFGVNLLGE